LVTFDDGYRTVYTLARPILQSYAIPAVVFICSDPVERRQLLWCDAIARVRGEAEVEKMKLLPFDRWLASCEPYAQQVEDADANALLTVAEVKTLAQTPGVEIGGHTATHPILARADHEHQHEQIARNKARLEEWIGHPVTAFAYPNGRPGEDYTPETVGLLEAEGFEAGFTTCPRFATRNEAPLERSRFMMLAEVSAAELAHRLCYSWRR
jgi:peptidoglycan/xylan/chitin deacetylase (PgdA/CDA1 family)